MKMYNFIQAVEYVVKPQDMGTSKWTLVRGEDDVVYQVKFNQDALSSNINEFIGNYLAGYRREYAFDNKCSYNEVLQLFRCNISNALAVALFIANIAIAVLAIATIQYLIVSVAK